MFKVSLFVNGIRSLSLLYEVLSVFILAWIKTLFCFNTFDGVDKFLIELFCSLRGIRYLLLRSDFVVWPLAKQFTGLFCSAEFRSHSEANILHLFIAAVEFDFETFYEALYNNLSKHLQGECVWGLGNSPSCEPLVLISWCRSVVSGWKIKFHCRNQELNIRSTFNNYLQQINNRYINIPAMHADI